MSHLRKLCLTGFIAATLSTSAFAAPDKTHCPHMGMQGSTHMPERMNMHMSALHDKLKITAAQEAGWKTFVESMRPAHALNVKAHKEDMEKLSAPERMEKHIELMKHMETKMSEQLAALKTFYATLTPEQQKVFDKNMKPRHARHARHGMNG